MSVSDRLWKTVGIPAALRFFGVPAIHTAANGDETDVTVILETQVVAVGEFGERMEPRQTLSIPSGSDARVGDTFSVDRSTDDDPSPRVAIFTAAQLVSDDGVLRTFAVREDG